VKNGWCDGYGLKYSKPLDRRQGGLGGGFFMLDQASGPTTEFGTGAGKFFGFDRFHFFARLFVVAMFFLLLFLATA
jgi:hypothetical protein